MELNFEEVSKDLLGASIRCGRPKPERFTFPEAETLLRRGLRFAVGDGYEWVDGYDEVVEWLTDTNNKGLFLMGTCGLGKTEIAENILPVIFHFYYGKNLHSYDATFMMRNPDALLKMKMLVVDDIGTDGETVQFGVRRQAFAELVDAAEKEGHLLILTSNLDANQIMEKYGDRVMNRLKTLCKCIVVSGKSLRH